MFCTDSLPVLPPPLLPLAPLMTRLLPAAIVEALFKYGTVEHDMAAGQYLALRTGTNQAIDGLHSLGQRFVTSVAY